MNTPFCRTISFLTFRSKTGCRFIYELAKSCGPRISLLVLILFFTCRAWAQYLYEPYAHYASDKGLPQASVLSMTADKKGFVWIGTYNGLARFDGNHISVFNLWDYIPKSSNRIENIGWLGNRLFVREFYKKFLFEITEQLNIKQVTDTGLLQHIHFNMGLQRFDHIAKPPPVPNAEAGLRSGYLFPLTTAGTSGYFVNLEDRFVYFSDTGNKDTRITWGAAGWKSWFLLEGILYAWDGKDKLLYDKKGVTGSITSGSLPLLFNGIRPDERKGAFFIANGNHAFLVVAGRIYHVLPHANGSVDAELLAVTTITSMINSILLLPGSDILLIGTETDGLHVLKKRQFKTVLFPVNGVSAGKSKELTIPSNDYIGPVELLRDSFILARGGGLLCTNGKVYPMTKGAAVAAGLFSKTLHGYFLYKEPGNDKSLIIADSALTVVQKLPCTEAGIAGYYNDGDTLYQGFRDGRVYKMLMGKDRDCRLLDQYIVPHNVSSRTYVSKVAPDTLLVACRDTIYLLSITTKKIRALPGIGRYIEINSMYTDKNGTIWLGTTGQGWYRYRHGKGLFRMPLDRNKYLLSTVSFTEDGHGYMWIGTFYGLFRLLKSEIDRITDPDAIFFYNHFTRTNGFVSDEFLGEYSNTSVKLPDGRLLLCNAIGMVLFDPVSVPVEQPTAGISFGNIWVDGAIKDPGTKQSLNPAFNSLSVEVRIPFMGNPYNLQVQYQLSGSGGSWTYLPEDRIIKMNRLPGGDYTLSVRMLKGFGTGEFITSTYHFTVLPQWYQTWWFFVLLLLFLYMVMVRYFRYRSRKLKEQKKLLEEQVEIRTRELRLSEALIRKNAGFKSRVTSLVLHDVRSPLFYLKKITLNIYKSTEGEIPEEYRDQLKELHLSVKEISEYAQNLFAWVSSQQDDFIMKKSTVKLFDVFEELCGNYHLLAEQNGNSISHSASNSLHVKTQADLLMIILRNLVDNAIKYTADGKVILSARELDDGIHIMVWDTGRGMSREKVERIMNDDGSDDSDTRSGMGYRYVKDLLKKMNGRLIIKSEPGAGSAITIILPLNTQV